MELIEAPKRLEVVQVNTKLDELRLAHGFAEDNDLMEFAEIVVRECLEVCKSVENDTEMNGLSDGALVCELEIKERFGIDE